MAASPLRHVQVYGLHVTDQALYRRYREQMTPILRRFGGDFGYDFVVSETLKSETAAPINRVFTMLFSDRASAERFFADPDYLAVRAQLFSPAVAAVTRIASFDEPRPSTAA